MLGAHEDQRPGRAAGDLGEHVDLVARCATTSARCSMVVDVRRRRGRPRGRPGRSGRRGPAVSTAPSRVAENSSRCAPAGVMSSSLRDVGQEAHVGHVVGLVEHGDLDRWRACRRPARSGRAAGRGWRRRCRRRAGAAGSAARARRRRRRRQPHAERVGRAGGARRGPARPARGSGPAPARGAGGRPPGCALAGRASIGRPNASVLPEPVCARPRTSRPARASGRVAAWIGRGVLMPRAVRAADQDRRDAELGERAIRRGGGG